MAFNELEDLELQHILRDCRVKMAELPQRLKDEFLDAVSEGRAAYAIQPVSLIRASLLHQVIESLGDKQIPPTKFPPLQLTLAECIKDQRRACGPRRVREGREVKEVPNNELVGINSDQLQAILEAAGIDVKEPRLIHA